MRGLDGDGSDGWGRTAHPKGVPKEKTGTGVFFGGRGMPIKAGEKTPPLPVAP